MEEKKKKYLFKILISGDGGVGKTTLIKRIVDNTFSNATNMTIGIDFHIFTKTITNPYNMDEKFEIHFQLWDFGGQERFRFMLSSYVSGAKASIILYDRSRFSSLFNMKEFVEIVRSESPNLPIILVGSKSDKIDQIDKGIDQNALLLCEQYNFFDCVYTSSKTGEGLNEVFEKVALKILEENHVIERAKESSSLLKSSISQSI